MSESDKGRDGFEPEPLAYDNPERCPAAVGAGYYCTLPSEHEGEHVWSESPRVEPDAEPVAEPPSEEWPLCPVCAGVGRVPPELQASTTTATCPNCKGLGQVRSGSLVEAYAIQQCDRCTGNGWVYVETLQPPAQPPAPEYQRTYP